MLRIEFFFILVLCGTLLCADLVSQAHLTQTMAMGMREMGERTSFIRWTSSDFDANNCTAFVWSETHVALRCRHPNGSAHSTHLLFP